MDRICLDQKFSTTRLLFKEESRINVNLNNNLPTKLFLCAGDRGKVEGGLITKGYFKRGHKNQSDNCRISNANMRLGSSEELIVDWVDNELPLITIITVVFNGEKFLEETIQSVIGQNYPNVEYIIIDGGSTDGTLDIILKYDHAINYWVSENDSGIYDAMNKALFFASGEWVNFMNCGDQFYGENTLDQIFIAKKYTGYDILFGDHEVIYPSGRKRIARAGKIEKLGIGSQFSHQASFIKTNYHKSHLFSPHNKIVADFEFYYLAWKTKVRFKYVPEVICSISAGGISDVRRVDSILGWWLVVDKNFLINIFYIILLTKEIFKGFIKKHFCWMGI